MQQRKKPLSNDEWDILRILWDAGEPLTRTEIFEKLPDTRKWDASIVSKLLNNMLEKDLIKLEASVRCGTHSWGRTFVPTKKQFDFIVDYSMNLASNVPKPQRALGLITSLLSHVSQNELDENHKCFWKLITPLASKDNIDEETIAKLKQIVAESKELH